MISLIARVVAGCLLLTVSISAASLASTHHVAERLDAVPEGWRQGGAPAPNTPLYFRLAVHQPRAAEFQRRALDISTPGHPMYGQHMKRDEIKNFLRPEPHVSQPILQWLRNEGVPSTKIEDDGDWIGFAVPVAQAEKMLQTRFNYYDHDSDGSRVIRTLGYSVPASLAPHIRMIQPTTRFGLPRSLGSTVFKMDDPLEGWVVPQSAECTTVVTPDCIRRLYKIDQLAGPDPRNKLGVSGFLEQYARYDDFNAFINRYARPLKGKSFEVAYINNGENLQNSSQNSGEASLDIQYTVALSNATAVYYSTGGRGPLVPDLDQPNPNDISNEPYLEQLLYFRSLKDEDLPSVLSTSYGENEQSVPKNYTDAICDMFCELGARGVSIIFSSGDDGPGNSCQTNDGKNTTRFNPIFPAACPFVTSVGGTILRDVEEGVYYSSGGFSDRHPRPEYQEKAVQGYLAQLGSRWEGLYNHLGRGFPDVAALGSNFSIFDHGSVHLISGTSASAPLFAAVVSNLNAARLAQGKGVLGFLNPFLYSLNSGLKDIVHGGSTGCTGTSRTSRLPTTFVPYASWNATKGWDPVTGLGTPEFDKLLQAALSLP